MTNSSKSKRQGGRYSRGKGATGSSAKGRGGLTRDSLPPVRAASDQGPAEERSTRTKAGTRPGAGVTGRLQAGETFERGTLRRPAPKRAKAGAGGAAGGGARPAPAGLRQVQLDAPPETATFRDRDGQQHTFADSKLRRIAAQILSERGKHWRYRAFPFPIFTDRGNEQTLHFDFYIYDAENTIIRLILVVPRESRELWDKVGRFKRQYPMYAYELWTPERLAALLSGRGQGSRLDF